MFASSSFSCRGGGGGETWLSDECPHFLVFQKYSLSMRNGAACRWAEGKLPFPLTCSQGWGSEWKAIWECLPSEVMNMVQIRGRGLSISSAFASPILAAVNCFLSFALQPHSCLSHFFLNLSLAFSSISMSSPSSIPPSCCTLAGFWGCAGWQVELWEVERARAAFADCGTESWDSMAFSENTLCSRNLEATQSHREPWPWAVSRKKNQHKSIESGHELAGALCVCVCTYWHMVFCLKWIKQSPSWIIVKAVHHWEINKLVFL